jgi:short subunit dehydrogenase-like uncharacterized protein
MTAQLVAEAGLNLTRYRRDKLPETSRRGGFLTPATAFGTQYFDRLKEHDVEVDVHEIQK